MVVAGLAGHHLGLGGADEGEQVAPHRLVQALLVLRLGRARRPVEGVRQVVVPGAAEAEQREAGRLGLADGRRLIRQLPALGVRDDGAEVAPEEAAVRRGVDVPADVVRTALRGQAADGDVDLRRHGRSRRVHAGKAARTRGVVPRVVRRVRVLVVAERVLAALVGEELARGIRRAAAAAGRQLFQVLLQQFFLRYPGQLEKQ